ncbi:uncharacterized protein JCM15063_006581 [Sporobolomyces koalae]|uniref:uncharacterized protein n=1 Tax=Sporobolomyces koalae TaxID=500713 RepID=UPI003172257A
MRDPRLPPSPTPEVGSTSSSSNRFSSLYSSPSTSLSVTSRHQTILSTSTSAHYSQLDHPPIASRRVMEPAYSRNHVDPRYRPSAPAGDHSPQMHYTLSPPESASRSSPPPAPAPVHRVYNLNCASCDTFLTNRGMRAVLLLKPHIVLFSTDAAPCHSETSWPAESQEEHVERTCECLTSSIACHGCGRVVGYHIVAPCSKCTDSVQKHQRSANHHRFVFHHNEVTSSERTYYPGERGVHNPVIVSSVVPRSRHPSPVPAPRAARRRVSIYDVEKELVEARLAPTSAPHSPPPSPATVTLLKAGDVLYWHHLISGGERTQPVDPRTRPPVWTEMLGR